MTGCDGDALDARIALTNRNRARDFRERCGLPALGVIMLAKCANPVCTSHFRYSSQGRIFRLDSRGASFNSLLAKPSESKARSSRRTEFFWLCPVCARDFIVVPDAHDRYRLAPRPAIPRVQKTAA
jgi:hypothetical protein